MNYSGFFFYTYQILFSYKHNAQKQKKKKV